MTISAKVVADSISPEGKRITTFSLEYPRFVHAELMTHRVFSRNASSSRAIPVAKMIERIKKDPALPIHWGANQPGMQADAEIDEELKPTALAIWLEARDAVILRVHQLLDCGLHKQVANRLLEPWGHIGVVLTSTELGNWYNLRYHPMAQPEIALLAKLMYEAQEASKPQPLNYGHWHLPFLNFEDHMAVEHELRAETVFEYYDALLKMSAARCARVSYLNHEGKKPTIKEDFDLFERLMGGNPKHASPTEHQARPLDPTSNQDHLQGNLRGWVQYRKTIPGEYLPEFKGPTT